MSGQCGANGFDKAGDVRPPLPAQPLDLAAGQIGGQQEEHVAEVDLPALAIGSLATVEDLVEKVDYLGISLFHLIQ